MNTSTKTEPIQLRFESKRQVVVDAGDEDRFVMTEREAALACKVEHDDKKWRGQWEGFLSHINEWCSDRPDLVDAAYVTSGDYGINVSICLKSSDYQFDIEDDLTKLDVTLSELFPLCITEVLQIPGDVARTLDLQPEALVVYADSRSTSGTSES